MDPKIFTEDAWGAVVAAAEGYPAFVPRPAPRELDLSKEAIALLDQASNHLGVLDGIGRRLPNPHLLISPYMRREAVLSSRIEGTQTSMSDLYAEEIDQLSLIRSSDVREVRNYVLAYEDALQALGELPLSLRLIRRLHRRLMDGVRGRERHPGRFRTYQNWVGARRGEDATYVGPPTPQMKELLNDFEHFLHDKSLRPLVQAGVLHYEFEAIHPFGDGNGRVGRLLVALFLHERGLLPQPLLYLSAYFERNRSDYYESLMRVSTHGDWNGWLEYFLEGVYQQAQQAAELADQLMSLQAAYREQLQAARVSTNVLALIDALFINPLADTKRVEHVLGVSQPTARAAIKTLEEHGLLTEITGRKWGTVYRANDIDKLLRGDQ
jgi:cell filamentation protein, protein adenylyltransferase